MTTKTSDVMPVEILEDRYEIGELLGHGTMGIVCAAHDKVLGIDVAVKIMREEYVRDPEMLARFSREASISTRMMSPHIVKVLGIAVTRAGTPCIVYERLHGETLAERIDRGAGLSLAAVTQIVKQTARALARAHSLGVVHLDVKPANIFLVEQPGGRFLVKLLDFGIAEMVGDDGRAVAFGGTPEYIAPEILRGERSADARADLYALGVVAFECLTGSCPFPGGHIDDVLWAVMHGERPSLGELRPDLSGPIDDWMDRALHSDPFWRFSSAKELDESLDLALTSLHVARVALRRAA